MWKGWLAKKSAAFTLFWLFAYIHVSTRSQMPDRQVEALRAECDELHIEHVSAIADDRPIFQVALDDFNIGDCFVVIGNCRFCVGM